MIKQSKTTNGNIEGGEMKPQNVCQNKIEFTQNMKGKASFWRLHVNLIKKKVFKGLKGKGNISCDHNQSL